MTATPEDKGREDSRFLKECPGTGASGMYARRKKSNIHQRSGQIANDDMGVEHG